MKQLLAFFTRKPKKQKVNDLVPKGTTHSIVPKEYLNQFPVWDSHKFKNIKVV